MIESGLSEYVPYVIYLLTLPIIILSIFVKTEIGLTFLFLLIPLQNVLNKIYNLPIGNQFIDILIISIFVGCLRQRITGKQKIFERTPVNLIVAIYVLFTFLELLWGSVNLGLELPLNVNDIRLKYWKNLMVLPFIYLITLNSVKNFRWFWIIIVGILVSIFMFDLFFIREFRWIKSYHYTNDMRIAGPFTYLGPNEMACFLAQYSMIVLGLLLFVNRRWIQIILVILLISTIYCLVYSFSRSGYFGFIFGTAFILFIKNKKLLFVYIILLYLAPSILPVSVMERIEMTSENNQSKIQIEESQVMEGQEYDPSTAGNHAYDTSTESRFELTEKAINIFKKSPFIGVGLKTYNFLVGMDTHNNYAKMLAETGIIGLIVYILLYYWAFRSGWKLYKQSEHRSLKGLGLGFSACVITNMVVNGAHDCWSYINLMGFYWAILALVIIAKIMSVEIKNNLA